MGKGQRSRDVRSQKDNKVAAKKTASWKGILATVLAVVLVVGMIALIYVDNSGILLQKTALETENFKVSAAMLQYATMYTYQNFVTTYQDVISYFGLDTNKSLDSQPYGDGTWLDYFRDSAEMSVKTNLVYAEAALEAGLSLDDADIAEIDETIETMKEYYALLGYTEQGALSMAFGKGVSWNDMRELQKITALAEKYEDKMYEDTEAALTDEDIEKYYDDNRDKYTSADVITYSETITFTDEETAESFAAKKTELLAKFNEIAANDTEANFGAALSEYIKATVEDETKADTAYTNASKSVQAADVDKDTSSWLFELADGAYVRQAGEIKVTEETTEATDTAKETYKVTVTYVKGTPSRDTAETKSVGHILFLSDSFATDEEAKAEAERVLALYKEGEMTKESFEKLGEEYTEDSSVFYDNVPKGQMVKEFNDWMFDENRKEGDVEIVKSEQYGYHIMYFVGDGKEAWYATCFDALVGEKTSAIYEELEKAHVITVKEDGIKAVKG